MRAKFQVCTVFVWVGGVTQINKQIHTHTKKQIHTYTSEIRNILDRVLASRGFGQWRLEIWFTYRSEAYQKTSLKKTHFYVSHKNLRLSKT